MLLEADSPVTLLFSMTSSASVGPNANTEKKEYLCLFHAITSGSLGDNLGSDEQEIIEMIYLIVDIEEKQVRFVCMNYLFFK